MKIIILPGLDGTGLMLSDFEHSLNKYHDAEIIIYPHDRKSSYDELTEIIIPKLPTHEDYIVIAESYAGPLSILIAQQKLPHLSAIIFAASFANRPNFVPKPMSSLAKIISFSSPLIQKISRPMLFGKWGKSSLYKAMQNALNKVSHDVLLQRIYDLMHVNELPVLKNLTLPMLYIKPTSDRLVTKQASKAMKKANPSIDMIEIDGPHFILQCQPKKCAKIVKNFIEDRIINDEVLPTLY